MSTNVIELVERRTRRVRLATDEADWLYANARGVIDVRPDRQRRLYHLTAGGMVGTLYTPRRPITITSRIPADNLPWLFGLDATQGGKNEDFGGPFDLIASAFADRLADVSASGLHREYREHSQMGPSLVGRLNATAQARESRRDVLHSLPDDLTPQLPCNAIPVGLARQWLASPLNDRIRSRLASALVGWQEVKSAYGPLPAQTPPGYEKLFALCRWLASCDSVSAWFSSDRWGEGFSAPNPRFWGERVTGLSASLPFSALTFPSTAPRLISLSRVFERLVTRLVGGEAQRTFTICPVGALTGPARPRLTMRPDVTLWRDGRPVRVVDAKWKTLPRESVVTADVYQALAYAVGVGVSEVVLVYPGRRRGWSFDVGSVRVRVMTLEVAGPRDRCERSGRRLAIEVNRR